MASDYDAITKYNEAMLGLDTASRKTQVCMYSDSTHFVYEILQNADDYGATEVFFRLSQDALLVEHNGAPFVEENVKAITYFGESTSRDDLVKTGRFGVGFKSVFAFTATPIVISGDEHFQIHGLYRVRDHPYPDDLSRSRTRITLPFNHETKTPDYVDELMPKTEAYSKISTRLKGLNMNTLLFTQNIREIRWEIEGDSGHYLREDEATSDVRKTVITDGTHEINYLVFSRVPKWRSHDYKAVEIAFATGEKGQISPIEDSLYVLFPTAQETHLQFILNGPFRTNPSRETIAEDAEFNMHLVEELCVLMRAVLPQLRERKLLTTQLLSILPNTNDKLRRFYSPVFDVIVQTFSELSLVPTDDNQFACAGDVFQGPAPLREVIAMEELSFFLGRENVCWAKGVQQNSRADFFLRGLGIEQWGWKQLQESLDQKFGLHAYRSEQSDSEWRSRRKDSWLQKFYIALAEAVVKNECTEYVLRRCEIIRVRKEGKELHVEGAVARFPKRGYRELPQVKPAILRGKTQKITQSIQESLVLLGVSEIGEEERVDLLLNTYYEAGTEEVSDTQHLQHMKAFIKWWKNKGDAEDFTGYAIFRVGGGDGNHRPEDCYLDSPLRQSGLKAIYSKARPGITQKKKIWSGYRNLDVEDFCNFAVDCGVADGLEIEEQSCQYHVLWRKLGKAFHYSRETATMIDVDYQIPNLPKLLDLGSREINKFIWDAVREADPKVFEARYRPNQRHPTESEKSTLILELAAAEWLPDKRRSLRKPSELTKEKLHSDFKYDNRNGWLDEIGFGESAKKTSEEYQQRREQASSLGVPLEMVDFLFGLSDEERQEEIKGIKQYVKQQKKARKRAQRDGKDSISYEEAFKTVFSAAGNSANADNGGVGGASRNPSRRRSKTSEEIAVAIENEGKRGERYSFTCRKKWAGKNDQVRVALKEWYGGHCQICEKTFVQRSGEPYFEGVYLVPRTTADWIDRVGNVLCLCPLHSAMFQFGPKSFQEDVYEQVMRQKVLNEGGDGHLVIQMELCGDPCEIVFAENHLIDLQEMIKADQNTSDEETE